MLMMGPIADNMVMPPAVRERHEKLRAAKFREVMEEGAFYGQPHSEPVEQGETDTKLGVGARRFGIVDRTPDWGNRLELFPFATARKPSKTAANCDSSLYRWEKFAAATPAASSPRKLQRGVIRRDFTSSAEHS
jgi:hypothetical protein